MVTATTIEGVKLKPIHDLVDARGTLQHMVRADDTEFFSGFGEIYFSSSNPGIVKGWHRQSMQTNLLSCIQGRLRLVLFDDREGSATRGKVQVVEFGDGHRTLVRVPPGVVYGWKNDTDQPALLANCTDRPHDPASAEKIDPASGRIPYVW